jgi:hypothetical protein
MNIRQTTRQLRQNMLLVVAGILAVTLVFEGALAQAKGPYLGQNPPGMTPEVFGPGIVSTDAHEFALSMNPDATEIYFSRGEGPNNIKQIMVTRLEGDGWTTPAPLFPDFPTEQFEPSVTPDGKHMHFMAFHVTEGQPMPGLDMYRTDREGTGWGKPYHLGAPFNPSSSMFCSFTNDGTVYTTDSRSGGMTIARKDGTVQKTEAKSGGLDIARTRPTEDGFGPYENLGKPINTDSTEMYPFGSRRELSPVLQHGRGTTSHNGVVSFGGWHLVAASGGAAGDEGRHAVRVSGRQISLLHIVQRVEGGRHLLGGFRGRSQPEAKREVTERRAVCDMRRGHIPVIPVKTGIQLHWRGR